MKALKERKVSLLFRRGLFILSILALAFAFAACGDSGGNGDPPIVQPPVITPPEYRALDKVVRIEITNVLELQRKSTFQGLPPDLDGAIVDLIWQRYDGSEYSDHAYTIRGDGTTTNAQGVTGRFITSPSAADWPGTGTDFFIVHTSNANTLSRNSFRADWVVPIDSLTAEAPPEGITWLADVMPDLMDDFELRGSWRYHIFAASVSDATPNIPDYMKPVIPGKVIPMAWASITEIAGAVQWSDPGNRPAGTPRDHSAKIPFSPTYPPIDFNNARPGILNPFISVTIGNPRVVNTGAQGVQTFYPPWDASIRRDIGIKNFYEPINVIVRPTSVGSDFLLRNDQFVGYTEAETLVGLNRLIANNDIRFEVQYSNSSLNREITWREFVANREYNWSMNTWTATPGEYFQALGRRTSMGETSPWNRNILQPEQPGTSQYWPFTVEYVRSVYGIDGSTASRRTTVTLEPPLYEFVNFPAEGAITRRGQNFQIDQYQDDQPASIGDVVGMLSGINSRYGLTGNYRRGAAGELVPMEMEFLWPMFNATPSSWWGQGTVAPIGYWFPAWPRDNWGNPGATNVNIPSLYRDWPLEIAWGNDNPRARVPAATTDLKVDVRSGNDKGDRFARPTNGYVNSVVIRIPIDAASGTNLSASGSDFSNNNWMEVRTNGDARRSTIATVADSGSWFKHNIAWGSATAGDTNGLATGTADNFVIRLNAMDVNSAFSAELLAPHPYTKGTVEISVVPSTKYPQTVTGYTFTNVRVGTHGDMGGGSGSGTTIGRGNNYIFITGRLVRPINSVEP